MAAWRSLLGAVNWTDGTNITEECPPNMTAAMHSRWVYIAFGQCVHTLLQYFAFFIGFSSIICWLLAQLPQLVKNFRTGKADEVLSFWFLLQWFAGDITNLVGAILTDQLAPQIATAVYFIIIDTATMLQFLYYLLRNQGVRGLLQCFKCKRSAPVLAVVVPGLIFSLLVSTGPMLWTQPTSYHRAGRTLLSTQDPVIDVHDTMFLTGYILGCLSAVLYVCSRLPQIIKNFMRCSVEGLSLYMFILAVLGNLTYGLGIFLYSVNHVFLIRRLPWLVGSIGTLIFDFTIFMQFIFYHFIGCGRKAEKGSSEEKQPLLQPGSSGEFPCLNKKGSIQKESDNVTKNSRQK